jgi:hypothetical protein
MNNFNFKNILKPIEAIRVRLRDGLGLELGLGLGLGLVLGYSVMRCAFVHLRSFDSRPRIVRNSI